MSPVQKVGNQAEGHAPLCHVDFSACSPSPVLSGVAAPSHLT